MYIKYLVLAQIPPLWVSGLIFHLHLQNPLSTFIHPSRGPWRLTLKDSTFRQRPEGTRRVRSAYFFLWLHPCWLRPHTMLQLLRQLPTSWASGRVATLGDHPSHFP